MHGAAGGLIQLLAGMWEMWKANTFAATAFSSYGGFWMGWSLYGILKSVRPCLCCLHRHSALRPDLCYSWSAVYVCLASTFVFTNT